MTKIFLSYRRQNAAGVAGRIYDRLRAHFSPGSIHWSYVAVLPLMTCFCVMSYVVTIQRGQQPPPAETFFRKPSRTEQVGDNKTASPKPRPADGSKPAPPLTDVAFPKPAPPSQHPEPSSPQPIRGWTSSVGIKLVRIEAGEFLMGTTKDQMDLLIRAFSDREWYAQEQPSHSVRLSKAFYLAIHEVTQGQYQAVMGENPSHFRGSVDLPVETVYWFDAVQFCNELSRREKRTPFYRIVKGDSIEVTVTGGNGYRLPTEAEWEYACRAKRSTLYPFGDDFGPLGEHAWYLGNSERKTHPVGQRLPNAWGLYDMLGNVWEWCADGFDKRYYASSPPTDPPGTTRTSPRVNRGGCWYNRPEVCRPANRNESVPGGRDYSLGFRVAAFQD